MNIVVNGEQRGFEGVGDLAALGGARGGDQRKVAHARHHAKGPR